MNINHSHIILLLSALFAFTSNIAQTEEKLNLNKGVNAYKKGDYGTAQEKFEQAYESNKAYNGALYNAANSAYRKGDFDKATEYYEEYASNLENKLDKAKAYHNLGNVYLKQNKLKESIESYKNALRNNPNDEDTRYNLSYALSKLKKQQQQQQNKDQNQDQNQDNKDNKDQDQNSDNKDSENKDDKNGDKSDQEKEGDEDKNKDGEGDKDDKNKEGEDNQNKPNQGDNKGEEEKEVEGKMSKGQIEKDLDAINSDEKKILEAIARKKGKEKGGNKTKDW